MNLDHLYLANKIQNKITELMEIDLNGGVKTGFSPYKENGNICFDQRWLFIMGIKTINNIL